MFRRPWGRKFTFKLERVYDGPVIRYYMDNNEVWNNLDSNGIENPNNLNLWLKVNGEEMQNSNTSDFIFNIEEVVSYISQFIISMDS